MPESEPWPNEATSSAVARALADVQKIAQRAADEAIDVLVEVAQDTIEALENLKDYLDDAAQADPTDGDRG